MIAGLSLVDIAAVVRTVVMFVIVIQGTFQITRPITPSIVLHSVLLVIPVVYGMLMQARRSN